MFRHECDGCHVYAPVACRVQSYCLTRKVHSKGLKHCPSEKGTYVLWEQVAGWQFCCRWLALAAGLHKPFPTVPETASEGMHAATLSTEGGIWGFFFCFLCASHGLSVRFHARPMFMHVGGGAGNSLRGGIAETQTLGSSRGPGPSRVLLPKGEEHVWAKLGKL